MAIIKQKEICGLEISVAEADTLHMRESGHQTHDHLLHFKLLPKEAHLLPLPEYVFQVLLVLDVFADDADSEGVVHGFIEKITVKLNDVRVILRFEQLHSLLLVFVEFIQ